MSLKSSKKKLNGEIFTPEPLAEYLANKIVNYLDGSRELKIFDPACGDGALLDALSSSLLERGFDKFSISGNDLDVNYLNAAKKRISTSYPDNPNSFEVKNFVEDKVGSFINVNEKYDIIIGNPPYVRTQNLGSEKSQSILKMFGLSGRVDLYYPFLINMTDSLVEGGLLGVITSNRYLTTKSGESVREYLMKHYDILEIIDLGDTKLFDAAVLPAIFIGRKKSERNKSIESKYVKIYEGYSDADPIGSFDSIYQILADEKSGCFSVGKTTYLMSVGNFVPPQDNTEIWRMNSVKEQDWLQMVREHTAFLVGDKFKVHVGVKSCADDVFFQSDIVTKSEIEEDFYSNLISQENISQWSVNENLNRVVYPHYDNNGEKAVRDITLYPKAFEFFSANESRLKSRSYLVKSKRKWYEYWVPQNPTLWKYPKLVFPDISIEPRFAIDTTGAIVNGNCYWLCAVDENELDLLYLIEGVANSRLMVKYHDLCFNNKLYNGRRRYLTQYIERYPLPDLGNRYSKRVIQIAKDLHLCKDSGKRKRLIAELNICVDKAFVVA